MKRQKFTGSRKHLLLRQSISNDGKTQGGRGVRAGLFESPEKKTKRAISARRRKQINSEKVRDSSHEEYHTKPVSDEE
jgi:hypothetical protein